MTGSYLEMTRVEYRFVGYLRVHGLTDPQGLSVFEGICPACSGQLAPQPDGWARCVPCTWELRAVRFSVPATLFEFR